MTLSNEEMPPSHPDLVGLSAFVDGRLADDERREWVAHLSLCAECRAILATLARGRDDVDAVAGLEQAPRMAFYRAMVWLPIAATLTVATMAGVAVWRANSVSELSAPAESTAPIPSPAAPAKPPPQQSVPAQTPSPPVSQLPIDPGVTLRRGGDRVVEGKTFRLVAGEWIDAAYDPFAVLPVEIVEGDALRSSTLVRVPALTPFAALGSRVTVVHDGVVYRFR